MISNTSRTAAGLALAGILLALAGATHAQPAPSPQAPPSSVASFGPSATAFDPVAATNAYLATVSGEKRARSDA